MYIVESVKALSRLDAGWVEAGNPRDRSPSWVEVEETVEK